MQKSKLIILLILPVLFGSMIQPEPERTPNALAPSIYLDLSYEEFAGSSSNAVYKNWISVYSYSFDATNNRFVEGFTSNMGKANGSSITLNIEVDQSLVAFFKYSLNGNIISDGVLEVVKPDGDKWETINMGDIIVQSVSNTGSNAADGTTELSVSLQFKRIKRTIYKYKNDGDRDGEIIMKWNYATNTNTF